MLFVIFDVEAIFIYPWAVVFDKIGMYAFIEMVIFILILVVGYVYAWKKEAFQWD
jgi:NADH-quinone oxidoreductase subunit A